MIILISCWSNPIMTVRKKNLKQSEIDLIKSWNSESISISEGAELLWVGGLSQTREQNRIDSLFKRLKEREKNCKKNIIVYLERIWLYIYRTLCEKKPKFIDFSPNIKKTNILPNNFHKIIKNIYIIFFSTKFIR